MDRVNQKLDLCQVRVYTKPYPWVTLKGNLLLGQKILVDDLNR